MPFEREVFQQIGATLVLFRIALNADSVRYYLCPLVKTN
jgi:hypothetical protein